MLKALKVKNDTDKNIRKILSNKPFIIYLTIINHICSKSKTQIIKYILIFQINQRYIMTLEKSPQKKQGVNA